MAENSSVVEVTFKCDIVNDAFHVRVIKLALK